MDDFNNVYNVPTPAPTPVQAMPTKDSNGFSLTALIMGICSLVFICCGGGLVLGALGIILALLSRGAETMNSQAKVGLGLSIGALALSLFIVPIMIATYSSSAILGSQEFRDLFNQELGHRYEETYDDLYNNFERDYDDFDNGTDFNFEDLEDTFGDT